MILPRVLLFVAGRSVDARTSRHKSQNPPSLLVPGDVSLFKKEKYVSRFAEAHQRQLFWVRTVFMEAVLPWLGFESCVCFPIFLQGYAL